MICEIYLAGGCFWGTEEYFKQIDGVVDTEVGYANGKEGFTHPTYDDVCRDDTGFAETVKVEYDAEKVSLGFLLRMYFFAIDPTTLNRQGNDQGTQYRTGIYYTNAKDAETIKKVYAEEEKKYTRKLQVEVLPLKNFYKAEEYHQDYLDKNPGGYCHISGELLDFARTTRIKKKE